jgi:hypothetical protein
MSTVACRLILDGGILCLESEAKATTAAKPQRSVGTGELRGLYRRLLLYCLFERL